LFVFTILLLSALNDFFEFFMRSPDPEDEINSVFDVVEIVSDEFASAFAAPHHFLEVDHVIVPLVEHVVELFLDNHFIVKELNVHTVFLVEYLEYLFCQVSLNGFYQLH